MSESDLTGKKPPQTIEGLVYVLALDYGLAHPVSLRVYKSFFEIHDILPE
jgi:hypothetical protein